MIKFITRCTCMQKCHYPTKLFLRSILLEAQQALLSVITATKETIADPEKHMGRFTREDKVSLFSL